MIVPLLLVFRSEEESWKSVVEPVFETLNNVVVAEAVEEPMAKSVVLVEPLLAWIENFAQGEEEATPIVPVTASAKLVEVAGSVPYRRLPMLSCLFPVVLAKKVSVPSPKLPYPVVMFPICVVVLYAPSKVLPYPEVMPTPDRNPT